MKNKAALLFLTLLYSTFSIQCSNEMYTQGKSLYNTHCANCHSEDGKGLRELYPPVVDSDFLNNNADLLPCIIRNGLSGNIVVNGVEFSQPMAGNKNLSDVEISNIINYIDNVLQNKKKFTSIEQVKATLESCK